MFYVLTNGYAIFQGQSIDNLIIRCSNNIENILKLLNVNNYENKQIFIINEKTEDVFSLKVDSDMDVQFSENIMRNIDNRCIAEDILVELHLWCCKLKMHKRSERIKVEQRIKERKSIKGKLKRFIGNII